MARPTKGNILEHRTAKGEITRTLRFRVNGQAQRVDLGGNNPDAYVLPTSSGRRFGMEKFRNRVLAGAIRRADESQAARGLPPLPDKLTPHSLRRTFASLL
jgi:hypothetical protein